MGKSKYTDRTVLNWNDYTDGYKNKPLGEIPFEILMDLYDTGKVKDVKLKRYIEGLIEIKKPRESKQVNLKPAEAKPVAVEKKPQPPDAPPTFKGGSRGRVHCTATDKIVYATEKLAKEEIRRIRALEQENKKPVRAYECEKCGGWHLTSIPFEEWEKQTEEETGNWTIYSKLMLKEYEQEMQLLNNQITHLQDQLRLLSEDHSQLKVSNKELKEANRILKREMGKDILLMTFEKMFKKQSAELEALKKVNAGLIKRLFELEGGKKKDK